MKTIHLIPLTALLVSALSAQAAVTAITSVSTTAPVANQTGISDLTVGGTTYSSLTIGTTTFDSGNDFEFHNGGGSPGSGTGSPGSEAAGISDSFVTTGAFGASPDITFGTTINDGDSSLIFLFERGFLTNSDTATINPFVGGSVDTNWSLSISQSDFGDSGVGITWNGNVGQTALGTTFSIADFTGGTGTLTNVTGIRITTTTLDTAMVGVAAVPEPSTFALMAGFLALGLVTLRRRLS